MGLIRDEARSIFDLSQISRGDCIRFQRIGDTTARNGFVTEVHPGSLLVLYCNIQNNATSYYRLLAEDVAQGIWRIWWTRDFQSVAQYPEIEEALQEADETIPESSDEGDGE